MCQNRYLLFVYGTRDCLSQTKEKNSEMEDELKCPVCLDFFNSPVCMTPCGHNYCRQCLAGMVDVPWLCPECRTEQQQRPDQLPRNFFLERTVQNYVESRRNICAIHELPKKLRKFFFKFTVWLQNTAMPLTSGFKILLFFWHSLAQASVGRPKIACPCHVLVSGPPHIDPWYRHGTMTWDT